MAVVVVAFNGTRVNDAETNTNWGNLGGGGPAPAAEPQLKYQGSKAVNRKVVSTVDRQGVQYNPGTGALDMTLATNRLWFLKGYVADFGDVNATWGVEARLGSDSANYYQYNIAGSGANRSVFNTYPAQGGYLVLTIDPNIAFWRGGTGGTPNLAAVDYFGLAVQFVTGGAKSENMALDAIDVGTGLTLTRGDGADADGTFEDFVTTDQGVVGNRWGVVISKGGVLYVVGLLTVGESATATAFTDTTSVVVFPDGYHSVGLAGVRCSLENVGTTMTLGSTLIGRGSSTGEDTRPDFTAVGTTGALTLNGTLLNFRNITFTSACAVEAAVLECGFLTQASADISDSEIQTNAPMSIACLQDPTFGTITDLHDCEFVQTGVGHAIELATVGGTYEFTNLLFTGYGATGQDDAAIDVTAASGTTTINVSGGDTPTYKSAGATVVINNNVTVTVTCKDEAGAPIQGAAISVRRASDNVEVVGGTTDINGKVEGSAASGTGDVSVRARKGSGGGTDYTPVDSPQTIGATAFSVTLTMVEDPVNAS